MHATFEPLGGVDDEHRHISPGVHHFIQKSNLKFSLSLLWGKWMQGFLCKRLLSLKGAKADTFVWSYHQSQMCLFCMIVFCQEEAHSAQGFNCFALQTPSVCAVLPAVTSCLIMKRRIR